MAKKGQSSPNRLRSLLILFILLGGGWWASQTNEVKNWKERILQYIDNRDIITLEAQFLPEKIFELHRQELIGNQKRTLSNTTLKYYPYLLLNVKYPDQQQTREGVLLWGMNDGEMILNTEAWETSHGFRDCLECRANRNDFKILQALARRQGSISIEDLQKDLHIEREMMSSWINEAKQKHLIIQKNNILQLHFENPKLLVTPQTKIKQPLVTKPIGDGKKISKLFDKNQIISIIKAAFGSDFSIRSEQEIFLPVYSFEILNPDGSIQTSEWNAVTGMILNSLQH